MGMAKTLYEDYFDGLGDAAVSEEVMQSIRDHEGFEGMPYKDTLGKETIGVGTLLPLTEYEAMLLALCRAHDVRVELIGALHVSYGVYMSDLPRDVDAALQEMAFQLGVPKLMGFKKMLAAIRDERWRDAAVEARDSRWARQTPARAEHVAKVFLGMV